MRRRKVELVVLSDTHLGTYGCRANELLQYLKSINPTTLILNGDIVDGWQFKKKYWPASHTKVLKEILNIASKGTKVYYLPGNHDEFFRRFVGSKMGNIEVENKVVLTLNGKKAWFFHGDVFDVTMQHSKWITRLGSESYDFLIWLNYHVNRLMEFLGKEKKSFSKKIKNGVKSAVKYINKFEEVCADIAIAKNYDYVVCGHIHQPEIREMTTENGSVTYLNSGDWIENLTALEYHKSDWRIYTYKEEHYTVQDYEENKDAKALFNEMLLEFQKTTAQ
ncbi:MAG: UDP-2,3-diacylglucosamine pyrophosphatase LpxH [Bacteroidia bacterium]|jgi:UDP-2,3-diacylglucosamine pyrophosphatase LpxH